MIAASAIWRILLMIVFAMVLGISILNKGTLVAFAARAVAYRYRDPEIGPRASDGSRLTFLGTFTHPQDPCTLDLPRFGGSSENLMIRVKAPTG